MSLAQWIVPDWPAPARVHAFVTTRAGGVSTGEYASMNLGAHSGDAPENVARNRALVREHLPADPLWLVQVHGTHVVDPAIAFEAPRADGATTTQPDRVCAVLTADCMPVFLCDAYGRSVAVAHAGWRGLAAGVLENAIHALGVPREDVHAWMGPAIGPDAFEVGPEVREAFLAADDGADEAFRSHREGKYMADLYILARRRLERAGVESIHGGGFCTFHDRERFFSYRREKASGRMGAFIWLAR
ncbi:MAG TPA: peptidoglycan editing factor PgeF [Usitatibacter sp.]|nr:peptidoglycan editing factor PgeF [Usitatibacter sp.]